jgi:hypothetical protein
MIIKDFNTTVITAEEGKYLTQSFDLDIENRVIATTVALGKNDSVDNWKEITKEEGNTIVKEQNDLRQMKLQNN